MTNNKVQWKPHSKSQPQQVILRAAIYAYIHHSRAGIDAQFIERNYKACLKEIDEAEKNEISINLCHALESDDRNDHYGFKESPALILRGSNLPEITAKYRINSGYVRFDAGYGVSLTDSQKDKLREQFEPAIKLFIEKNLDRMKADAKNRLKEELKGYASKMKRELMIIDNAIEMGYASTDY